jgi:hypothetical protein
MGYQKKKGIKLPSNPNHIHYMMDNYRYILTQFLSSTKAGKGYKQENELVT